MVLFWITLLVALIGSNADGEFAVLHTPESLSFVRTAETWESHLKEIFSAALGLSVEYFTEWRGLYILDPFATPEAVVEVHVDGVRSLIECSEPKTKIFHLIVDENEPHTFKGLQQRIKQHFGEGRNKVVNVKLFSNTRLHIIRRAFGTSNGTDNKQNRPRKLNYLNPTVEEDIQFLDELDTLQTIIEKVRDGAITPDNLIDFYHLRYRTLHVLADFYGPTSAQTKEAKHLLGDALKELTKVFVKAYDRSVLVTVVTTDVVHARRSARSVTIPPSSKRWPYQWLEPPLHWKKISLIPDKIPGRRQDENEKTINKQNENEPPDEEKPIKIPEGNMLNEARLRAAAEQTGSQEIERLPVKNKNPPIHDVYVIFNIFLWLGVSLGFSMLAIIYACMEMDPGRNTIIYRLTTMRTTMKKD